MSGRSGGMVHYRRQRVSVFYILIMAYTLLLWVMDVTLTSQDKVQQRYMCHMTEMEERHWAHRSEGICWQSSCFTLKFKHRYTFQNHNLLIVIHDDETILVSLTFSWCNIKIIHENRSWFTSLTFHGSFVRPPYHLLHMPLCKRLC